MGYWKRIFIVITLSFSFSLVYGQTEPAFFKYYDHPWVDSVYNSLSLDERIAQLIFVPSYSADQQAYTEKLVEKYNVGGVVFFKNKAAKVANMVNAYNAKTKTPLIYAIDGEWGIGMRITDGISYQYAMTLGAVQDETLIYEMGKSVGRHCKRLGIHLNFAPVVDVNNNPLNPVISYRSFGENPRHVSNRSIPYLKGMQAESIAATAKHFPGHGNTSMDSHYGLPVLPFSKEEIHQTELYPFKKMIDNGISGIMSAHLQVPSYDDRSNTPASLSKPILEGLLQEELNFQGLIITDGIQMQAITKHYGEAKAHAIALAAGNDIVEFSYKVPEAILEVKKAIQAGTLSVEDIEHKCRKVLAFKYWSGASQKKDVDIKNLTKDLNTPKDLHLREELAREAITVLRNKDESLPIRELSNKKIAVLSIGRRSRTSYQRMAAKYTKVDFYNIDLSCNTKEVNYLLKKLKRYDYVIAGVHRLNMSPNKKSIVVDVVDNKQEKKTWAFGVNPNLNSFVKALSAQENTIMTVFGNPYALNEFSNIQDTRALLLGYQDTKQMHEAAMQMIFGAIESKGELPVTINEHFKFGDGLKVKAIGRLSYARPEAVGMNSDLFFQKIDSLAEEGIELEAYPGCQILVAKEGKVILEKSYGYHTYDEKQKVTNTDYYDLASVTKITAALPAVMKFTAEGKMNLDTPFSRYWDEFKDTDKRHLNVREILAHNAGLRSYIPFWGLAYDEDKNLLDSTFQKTKSEDYSIQVAPDLYVHKDFKENFMFPEINESKLFTRGRYKYSGLFFLLFPDIVKNMTNTDFDTYLNQSFYNPLGAQVYFNAHEHMPLARIVPTEKDEHFRKQQIHGFVHDEAAAVLGGISGNAGLFSNANELAKILQMYIQKGAYGGKRYIPIHIMDEFTKVQYPEDENRRGLGFDKASLDYLEEDEDDIYPCESASAESYGHSGFTGTFVWLDPKEEMIFIFLCNRVYPTRENTALYDESLRGKMLEEVYKMMTTKPSIVL